MNLNDLRAKKIAILGFGVEGKAMADYLSASGIAFDLLDKNPELEKPENFSGNFISGENYLDSARNYEIIFRSPGISYNSPQIQDAKSAGTTVTSQIKYFFDNCPSKIIGVTGTKGKGTTSNLIYNILKAFGKTAYLGGNFGSGVVSILGDLKPEDFVVLELSSFQLWDLEKSPHIAVVLMVEQEHLDVHRDEAEYVEAKSSITNFQGADDFAVVNFDFPNSMKIGRLGKAQKFFVQTLEKENASAGLKIENGIFADEAAGEIYLVNDGAPEKYFDIKDLCLRGFHMVQNVCAAVMAAKIAGAGDQEIKKELAQFKGLEHRMEFVAEIKGVKYYNDSFGTTPQASIAAAKAFSENEIIICGGADKKADYVKLGRDLSALKNLKAAVLIGVIAPQIERGLRAGGFSGAIVAGARSMQEAVLQAARLAKRGDVVILAPATSSFDMFKNYKDRGNQFKQSVLNAA